MKLSRFIAPVACAALLFGAGTSVQAQQPAHASTLLGTSTRVELSCANVITSLAWWTRVGFLPVPQADERPDSMITVSDGQVTITLTKRSQPSPTLVFQHPDLRSLKDSLEALGSRLGVTVDGPSISEIRLASPNGVHLAVRSTSREPWRPHLADSNTMCGKLTELSIGTSGDITDELIFWERLGFAVKREGRAPYHYALLTDGTFTATSLRCRSRTSLRTWPIGWTFSVQVAWCSRRSPSPLKAAPVAPLPPVPMASA